MSSNSSITVNFSDPSGTQSNQLRASYESNDDGTGTIKLYNLPTGESVIVTPVGCNCVLSSSGVTKTAIENHSVVQSSSVSLDSTAQAGSSVSVVWRYCTPVTGTAQPAASLASTNDEITLTQKVKVGILTVTYTEIYDVYDVSNISEYGGVVLFESVTKGDTSVDVPAQDNLTAAGKKKDVIIEVRDYCTDTPLSGATVTVTGPNSFTYTGITTATGRLPLGILEPGKYTTTLACTGYLPNANDLLANDGFEV